MSTERSSLSHLLDTNDPPLDSNSELHILDTIQSLEASIEAALTQLSDSRATTARLEEQIGELSETLRKYRAIFAPARKLPPELVSYILRYALPDDYVSGSSECVPWTLGHICRSWRVTALADSFLWSFITLGRSTWTPSANLVPALECQLSRTNKVPLSVVLSTLPLLTEEVLSILLPTAPRWRLLRFHRLDDISWITELQGHLPSLERLEFMDGATLQVADIFSQNVPRLRIVDLFEAGFSDCSPAVHLPFSQLTHYRAAWSYETHATNLGARNLEVCVIGTVDVPAELPPVPLPQTAHLPRLRALHLESLHFLLCITTPAWNTLPCSQIARLALFKPSRMSFLFCNGPDAFEPYDD